MFYHQAASACLWRPNECFLLRGPSLGLCAKHYRGSCCGRGGGGRGWQQRQLLKFGKNEGWGLDCSNTAVLCEPWYDCTWEQAARYSDVFLESSSSSVSVERVRQIHINAQLVLWKHTVKMTILALALTRCNIFYLHSQLKEIFKLPLHINFITFSNNASLFKASITPTSAALLSTALIQNQTPAFVWLHCFHVILLRLDNVILSFLLAQGTLAF